MLNFKVNDPHKQINNINVEMTENQFINTSKGIVYIYDYDLTNFELLQCGLKESNIIGNVEIAKMDHSSKSVI